MPPFLSPSLLRPGSYGFTHRVPPWCIHYHSWFTLRNGFFTLSNWAECPLRRVGLSSTTSRSSCLSTRCFRRRRWSGIGALSLILSSSNGGATSSAGATDLMIVGASLSASCVIARNENGSVCWIRLAAVRLWLHASRSQLECGGPQSAGVTLNLGPLLLDFTAAVTSANGSKH